MALENVTDEELFATMIAVDKRLMEQGHKVSRRSMEVPRLTLLEYGIEEMVIMTGGPRPKGPYQRVEDMFTRAMTGRWADISGCSCSATYSRE